MSRDSLEVGKRIYPLSWQQEMLWLHMQLEPSSPVYNNPIGFRLRGAVDPRAFQLAMASLVERHEVLRYVFEATERTATQRVGPAPEAEVIDASVSGHAPTRESDVLHRLRVEARRPFDLHAGPLCRATLIRGTGDEHWAVLTLHHLISDAWSVNLLIAELQRLYVAHARRQPVPPRSGTLQYGDFALWQRSNSGPDVGRNVEFWRPRFERVSPVVLGDRSAADAGFEGAAHPLSLKPTIVARMDMVAAARRMTTFAVLLTALAILLHRYTRETTVTVWVPMAGRARLDLETMLGCFVATLPIVIDVSEDVSADDLLTQVKDELTRMQDHQDLSYDGMISGLRGTGGRHGAGQVMLSYNALPERHVSTTGLEIVPLALDTHTAKCDIEFTLRRASAGIAGRIEYRTGAFSPAHVAGLAAHWSSILESLVARPEARVSEIWRVPPGTRTRLLAAARGASHDLRPGSFLDVFAAQVSQRPHAIAAVDAQQSLTYAQLDRRSSLVAGGFASAGAREESIVAVALERSVDFLAAMIAAFKAGAAYMPLDPSQPQERNLTMRRAAGADLVACRAADRDQWSRHRTEGLATPMVAIDAAPEAGRGGARAAARIGPRHLAYVIFTSGSTGQPKGAMVEHRGMLNHLHAKVEDLSLTADDVIAETASTTFDISVWQFLAALMVGARVHVVPDEVAFDATQLLDYTARHGITILEVVPSMVRAMLEHSRVPLPQLRWLILTGETLAADVAQLWLERYPGISVMNAYGPTECSDDVTHWVVRESQGGGGTVPIGRPVRNMDVYVIDADLQPVPAGVPGEVYVGGIGVGRGYAGDPVRTAAAFLPDPFAGRAGARLYRTGDLARLDPDGVIHFMGRVDQQVKVRGFRIEPGEIEAQLLTCVPVQEAAVVVARTGAGDPSLVAYVVMADGGTSGTSELRRALWERLPAYMIPSAIVAVDRLPRTASGKVDRGELSARPFLVERPPARAAGPAEQMLAEIWQHVLGIADVRVDDNFFEIGGNSLSATRMLARIAARFHVTLSLRTVFEAPTIAELVSRLAEAVTGAADPTELEALLSEIEADPAAPHPSRTSS